MLFDGALGFHGDWKYHGAWNHSFIFPVMNMKQVFLFMLPTFLDLNRLSCKAFLHTKILLLSSFHSFLCWHGPVRALVLFAYYINNASLLLLIIGFFSSP